MCAFLEVTIRAISPQQANDAPRRHPQARDDTTLRGGVFTVSDVGNLIGIAVRVGLSRARGHYGKNIQPGIGQVGGLGERARMGAFRQVMSSLGSMTRTLGVRSPYSSALPVFSLGLRDSHETLIMSRTLLLAAKQMGIRTMGGGCGQREMAFNFLN